MKRLTILHDTSCPLCNRVKRWIERQESYVELEFVPAGSRAAVRRFPGLDPETTLGSLTVVADDSAVYRGDRAFVLCLWALRPTRAWSLQLAAKGQSALARRIFEVLSRNRHRASEWMHLRQEGQAS